jgi:hypothetical protein
MSSEVVVHHRLTQICTYKILKETLNNQQSTTDTALHDRTKLKY